ncbi:MAG: flagellar protein FlgN [Granulosicoccus sp.]|nr:flagellar protein FlgN [Granulosicoccus sp.]
MTANVNSIGTADELLKLLSEFNRALENEQKSLLELEAEQLLTVSARKQQILERIGQIETALLEKITTADTTSEDYSSIQSIQKLISRCREQNRDNGVLVAQGLKICRNSIGFLNSTVQQQSVELYTPTGQANSQLGSRKIGEA